MAAKATTSKSSHPNSVSAAKAKRPMRGLTQPAPGKGPIKLGALAEFLGYALKRAQLRIFDDFIQRVASLKLTPAQFSVLLLVEANPGRNQTEIAKTLGILRPNFVALLDDLENRDLCVRVRSSSDRRSHILALTEKGRGILARTRKTIETRHEKRLKELLGEDNRLLLLAMLGKIAREF